MIDKNFGVVFVTVKAHFSDVSRDRRSRQPDCMRYFVARGTLDVMTFFSSFSDCAFHLGSRCFQILNSDDLGERVGRRT